MRYSGTQLSFLPQVESYEINGSGGEQICDCVWTTPDIVAAAVATISGKRKHRPKGGATGWLETRIGNRKRKNPSVSYYYRWDSPQGRITEYVKTSKLSEVNRMLAENCTALDILCFVVDEKKKLSKLVESLLANRNSVSI